METVEAFTMVAGICVVLVIAVVVLILISRPKTGPRSAADVSVATLANAHEGLTVQLGSMVQKPTLSGTYKGHSVRVHWVDKRGLGTQSEKVATLEIVAAGGLGQTLIHGRGNGPWGTTLPGGGPVKTGDRGFDHHVVVRSAEPDEVQSRLSAEARELLRRSPSWSLTNGRWSCTMGSMPPAAELNRHFDHGIALAEALKAQGTVAQRLEALVEHDPVPEVRASALRTWCRVGPPPASTLARLAGGDDAAAVVAAEALGAAGHEALDRLLTAEATRREAAIALGQQRPLLADELFARTEAALIEVLEGEEGRPDVIRALGAAASTRAVPALERFADGGLLGNAQANLAQAAIRSIQGRAEGAEAGQVSIVDPVEHGALSVARGRSGQVSES